MTEGHIAEKLFGARVAGVVLLTFGRGRIVIGPVGACWYEDAW